MYDVGLGVPKFGEFLCTAPMIYLTSKIRFNIALCLLKMEHWMASNESFRKIWHDIVVLTESKESVLE